MKQIEVTVKLTCNVRDNLTHDDYIMLMRKWLRIFQNIRVDVRETEILDIKEKSHAK